MAALSKVESKVVAVIASVICFVVIVAILLNLAEQGKEGKDMGLS